MLKTNDSYTLEYWMIHIGRMEDHNGVPLDTDGKSSYHQQSYIEIVMLSYDSANEANAAALIPTDQEKAPGGSGSTYDRQIRGYGMLRFIFTGPFFGLENFHWRH